MTVLIHFPVDRVLPKGGPAGYLFNLKQGLEEIGANDFEFLPAAGVQIEKNDILRALIPNRIKDKRRLRNLLKLPAKTLSAPVDYSSYDAIHFHSTEEMYLHRDALESYQGKVMLTSHSPCVYHKELISRLNPVDAKSHSTELKDLAVIDDYAFRRADVVVFPCPESEEPYFNTWDGYADARDEFKLRYLPTGISGCTAKVGRLEIRERYGIPHDAFLMCYVGRHNSIKGYDLLVENVSPLLGDSKKWMLVAGREGPIFAPRQGGWVEAGWTDDPHSIIAAADVFILPNRETYFDLVLLEVLSLGTPVVATRTGGNKYFENMDSKGIMLYEDVDSFRSCIEYLENLDRDVRIEMGKCNQRLFEKSFSCKEFARGYVKLVDSVVEGGI